jgi:hypothetical protein
MSNEDKMVMEKTKTEPKMIVPPILCELFVHGTEEEKPKLKKILDELQIQMDKARRNKHKIRVCWYIDKGELSESEKIDWFSKEGKCKYYKVITVKTKVSKDFVKDLLNKIRIFENAFKSLKGSEINIFNLIKSKNEPKEATVIE